MSWRNHPWTEDDTRRYMELRRIFGPDRHGSVDGVEFDLRHPSIDPKEWFTNIIGCKTASYGMGLAPFLWFPWMGTFDAEALRVEHLADEKRFGRAHDKKRFKALVRQFTPEHFVDIGDKLFVDRVEREAIGGAFEHPHDNEIRHAYLHIVRANGKIQKVKTPLTFVGNTSLFAPRSSRQYFEIISRRILDHFGLNQLSDVMSFPEDELDQGGYALGALERAFFLAERTQEARRLALGADWRAREERDAIENVRLLNDAVLLGYIWAKAEDEMGMRPLAEATLRAKRGGERGGRRSGAARRTKRAKTWEPAARTLALQIRAGHPTYSQDRVANEIITRWKEADFDPPGHKTLKELISAMEKSGDLPARKSR
jgi:hypothetical protein